MNEISTEISELSSEQKIEPSRPFQKVQAILLLLAIVLLFTNQFLSMQLGKKILASNSGHMHLSGELSNDIASLVTPTSNPFYAVELGLDFVNPAVIDGSIQMLASLAPFQGQQAMQLTSQELDRYITIGTEPLVTCEFCCGVKTLVREDGSPSCGCAHSKAMRGTVAYLLRNYPQMTNADIAYEIMRQKGLYFPKQMQQRMGEELAGDETKFTADIQYLLLNVDKKQLASLQQQARSSGFQPSATDPNMVGGC